MIELWLNYETGFQSLKLKPVLIKINGFGSVNLLNTALL